MVFSPKPHPFKAQGNLPDPAAWVKPFCTIFAKPCTRTVPAQGFLSMCCLTSRWKNMVPKKNAFPKSKIPIFLCRHLVGHQCLAKLIQGSFAEMGSVQLGSIWVHSQTKRKHTSRTTQYVVWWWWQRKRELFCILLSTVRIAGHIGPTSLPLEETSPWNATATDSRVFFADPPHRNLEPWLQLQSGPDWFWPALLGRLHTPSDLNPYIVR